MMAMDRDDPAMRLVWSPMSQQGQEKFVRLRTAIQSAYGPHRKTPMETLQDRYARAAKRSADDIFFQAFGSSESLLQPNAVDEDGICADIFSGGKNETAQTRQIYHHFEPDAEPSAEAKTTAAYAETSRYSSGASYTSAYSTTQEASSHVSQLVKPTRLQTPKRVSLKRMRAGECSAEKELILRKPRITLGDTTNLIHSSVTTTTMPNPWDRHNSSSSIASTSSAASTILKSTGLARFSMQSYQSAFSTTSYHPFSAPFVKRPSPVKTGTTVASTRVFTLR